MPKQKNNEFEQNIYLYQLVCKSHKEIFGKIFGMYHCRK